MSMVLELVPNPRSPIDCLSQRTEAASQPSTDLLRILIDVANGLAHLHHARPPVIPDAALSCVGLTDATTGAAP